MYQRPHKPGTPARICYSTSRYPKMTVAVFEGLVLAVLRTLRIVRAYMAWRKRSERIAAWSVSRGVMVVHAAEADVYVGTGSQQ